MQTAVTLHSLLQYSGQHFDRIYFIEEPKQPQNTDFSFLLEGLGNRVIRFVPSFFLWTTTIAPSPILYWFTAFRYSLRYQYAWERSDKKYLLLIHNDVLFRSDVVGRYLEKIGTNIGIGEVGQCWNCPAFEAGFCDSYRYQSFRPTVGDVQSLAKSYWAPRKDSYFKFRRASGWPLPECRLNEWSCLVNLELARPLTVPFGAARPFGAMYLDIGTEWFYDMATMGQTVRHEPPEGLYSHAWLNEQGNGHSVLFNPDQYRAFEVSAQAILEDRYGYRFS